jgi:putative transposase
MLNNEIYFWTATIRKWNHLLKPKAFKEIIVGSLKYLVEHNKIEVFGFVIMPNHVHVIWRIKTIEDAEQAHTSFLKYTAHEFLKQLKSKHAHRLSHFEVEANNKKHEFWQRDALAIRIFSEKMAFQKLEYIHLNPLARHWNLVQDPNDYFYSSCSFYERNEKRFDFLKDLREEF